jgi:hypothetical protein
MMAITTKSSISVKADCLLRVSFVNIAICASGLASGCVSFLPCSGFPAKSHEVTTLPAFFGMIGGLAKYHPGFAVPAAVLS